ncbi:transposase [Methylobacterium sp. E-065]|uniref:transposase n=1 Tax=Methylobacterium sp. E-065 TaxID=2836583 RepID=UPI00391C4679
MSRRKRGSATGPGKPGTKHHLVTDARGTPLGFGLSGADRHDSVMMAPTLDAIPALRNGRRGRPRHRPDKLHADKAYDAKPRRRGVPSAGDHAAHRPPRHREQRAARPPSRGRQAHPRVVQPLPPPARPLRAMRRHLRSLHPLRLRHQPHGCRRPQQPSLERTASNRL